VINFDLENKNAEKISSKQSLFKQKTDYFNLFSGFIEKIFYIKVNDFRLYDYEQRIRFYPYRTHNDNHDN